MSGQRRPQATSLVGLLLCACAGLTLACSDEEPTQMGPTGPFGSMDAQVVAGGDGSVATITPGGTGGMGLQPGPTDGGVAIKPADAAVARDGASVDTGTMTGVHAHGDHCVDGELLDPRDKLL